MGELVGISNEVGAGLSDIERVQAFRDINDRFAGLIYSPEIETIFGSPDSRMLTVVPERLFADGSITVRAGYGDSDYLIVAAPDWDEQRRRGWSGQFFVPVRLSTRREKS